MKLKQRPEDFVVEELDALSLGGGRFSIYRLSKRGLGTIEAAAHIAREFGVARTSVGFGGLKDRWAETHQKISIENGPERNLKTEKLDLVFLGRAKSPVARAGFDRNRFVITIRDLWEGDLRHMNKALEEIRTDGVPNYFDSQRFGSAKGADDFIAKRLVLRDFEGALKLAIATPTEDDRSAVRKTKAALRKHWGRWDECLKALPPKSVEARIVKKAAQGAWGAAFETIDRSLRLLYASAYQSYLWNQVLERLLRKHVMPSQLFKKTYAQGRLWFYRRLPAKQRERFFGLTIKLARRGVIFADPEVEEASRDVVKAEGFSMDELKIRGLASTYFGRGRRSAVVIPSALSAGEAEPDELNAKRLKVKLSFELPKGSYATILIKRIFH
jgi:tRNA pseudouridine13 synthase